MEIICSYCGSKTSICLEGVEVMFCDNYQPAPEVAEIVAQMRDIIETTLNALDTPKTKNISDKEDEPSTSN